MEFKGLVPFITEKAGKYSPVILASLSAAGVVGTAVLAVKATPKATELLNEYKETHPDPKPMEVVKVTWKEYAPAIVCGVLTIAAMTGSTIISHKRIIAGNVAADMAWATYENYRDVVIEKLGEKKEDLIRGEADARYIERTGVQVPAEGVQIPSTGELHHTLCYDKASGRYFYSDIEFLRRSVNDLNARLLDDSFVSLNDWYELIGLDLLSIGDDLGWRYDDRNRNMVDLHDSSILAPDGTPCFCVSFNVLPRWM